MGISVLIHNSSLISHRIGTGSHSHTNQPCTHTGGIIVAVIHTESYEISENESGNGHNKQNNQHWANRICNSAQIHGHNGNMLHRLNLRQMDIHMESLQNISGNRPGKKTSDKIRHFNIWYHAQKHINRDAAGCDNRYHTDSA